MTMMVPMIRNRHDDDGCDGSGAADEVDVENDERRHL